MNKSIKSMLVLAVLAAVIFWIVRIRTSEDVGAEGPYTIYCPTCGEQEAPELKWEGINFLCPECNKFVASFQDPSMKPPRGLEEMP